MAKVMFCQFLAAGVGGGTWKTWENLIRDWIREETWKPDLVHLVYTWYQVS